MLKLLICIGFICVVGVGVGANVARDVYSCYKDKSLIRKVKMYGQNFTCDDYYVCNENCVDNYNDCDPCTRPRCYWSWTCKENGTVVSFDGSDFKCPQYSTCIIPRDNDCTPCIRNKCTDPKVFECSPTDPTKVIHSSGILATCENGKICNSRWEAPCTLCVDSMDDIGAARSANISARLLLSVSPN